MEKTNRILFFILICSFFFCVSSIFLSKKEKVAPKGFDSSILNQKYKTAIKSIEIENSAGLKLILEKNGEVWTGSQEKFVFISDEKLIDSMIDTFSKVRKVYKISDNSYSDVSKKDDMMINFSVSFFDEKSEILSKTDFISTDTLTRRISFFSERNGIFYESEDDLSHFLNCDMNYWTHGEIFSEITDSVQIDYEDFSGGKNFSLTENATAFKTASYDLMTLRHGHIVDFVPSAPPIFEITVHDGNGRKMTAQIYKSGDKYFLSRKIIPSDVFDSPENSFAFASENVFYEISGWTYNKMIKN